MQQDELFMRRCIDLAMNGLGNVAPNPMVGCVIVHHGLIVGEGFHAVFGGPHAEVAAINATKNKEILNESTLYVSLEPCCHFGKTPPCTDKIIQTGIKKVVVGIRDPFAQVQGMGIARLREAGVEVVEGVLEADCAALNKRFFTFHQKKRPYVILKWAQSLDGFIDKTRDTDEPHINWITGEKIRLLVHRWRSEEQAILTGKNTVLKDDPQLTVREWYGKNPLRLVIDRQLAISSTAKIMDNAAQTVVFNSVKDAVCGNIEYKKLDFSKNIIPEMLTVLYEKNIQSLIVEGGCVTLQSFIDEGCWDEARVFSGNCFFFNGIRGPVINGRLENIQNIGADKLSTITNNRADSSWCS
ncbi:MAG TPA: bifunctional diaminohydroxyphosphoribosylaminopyrimidine deaminase/5-amino-6-(5-phosphoribosylamino)uracil reductase RibD [Bacteroidales bacterium]|nr:bifunctional diaminohydroxyphosphoribosylaminopyrimidine deaminase/5-amino-6-(5-phosphoribosylamino)uracil reductase RibD [Bacteroidales bacterium]